ncbi:Hsp20/alpha crystallin family protein [Streptosporangium amethystogenes]|uniref:Hsp20/alpha crystallin family protein n=1 Tax=Streptosporangium amethystogenes TaxID=2002 RepID=UPI0004C950FB|nr:Hsp20/alpha crystallin family protein [Streptosporangium amethystogenes]
MTLPVHRRGSAIVRPGMALGMPLGMRDPFAQIEDLYGRMDQLIESAFGGPVEGMWAPLADLSETDEAFVADIDLPGVKKDDIDVEVNDRELVVTAEIKEKEAAGRLHRRMRRIGRFEHRVLLPGEVNPEQVSATLSDGVLTVTVPRVEKARPHHVEVKAT